MAKPELGTKRVCPSCGTKYYDLKRDPITCPSCGTIFEIVAPQRSPAKAAAVVVAPVAEAVIEREPDTISLEDAEAEENEAEVVANEDEEAIPEEAEALEVETEAVAGDDEAAFLPEEEEEEGDVAGLLDVDAEDEDEV